MTSAPASEQRFSWLEIFSGAISTIGGKIAWADESGSAGLLVFPDGQRLFFHKGVLDINQVAAARIAKDKAFTTAFLATRGHRVPEERAFFHDSYAKRHGIARGSSEAAAYAGQIGYPVYVKPVHLSQGRGVAKVHDCVELMTAIEGIRGQDTLYLVQRAYSGSDIRVILIEGEVVFGFERTPLTVTGDGASTMTELIHDRQRAFQESGRDTIIDLADWRLSANLRRAGMGMDCVAPRGASIRLHDITNLSVGGTARECTRIVRTTLGASARRIASDMNLGFCGIDFIVPAPAEEHSPPLVLEVNSAPGLDHYLYSGASPLEEVQRLYAKLLGAYLQHQRQDHPIR